MVKMTLSATTQRILLVGCFGSIVKGACFDQVACRLYDRAICKDPQYIQWSQNNCPNFCGLCQNNSDTSNLHDGVGRIMDQNVGFSTCKDAITNCAQYGTQLCNDVKFYNWVNENCRAHCKRCSTTCEDKIPNCNEYGVPICSQLSYYNWVEMNCRRFCARCAK